MQISREKAEAAVQTVADAMDIDLMTAAEGLIKIVNESMLGALRLVSVEQGYDPRDFALVGFGGAGPLHANALGILTGSWPVIVPPGPGVLCAYGDATTQVQDEATQSFVRRADDISVDECVKEFAELKRRASLSFEADGIPADQQEVIYQADIRYAGQAFQLTLDTTEDAIREQGLKVLTDEFDRQHEQLFTFAHGKDHEVVTLRAVVRASRIGMADIDISARGTSLDDAKIHDSRFYYDGEWHEAAILNREKLGAGTRVDGPAIVQEMDSTTLILPGHHATVDDIGNLLINPND